MKCALVFSLVGLTGCETVPYVVCAPRYAVELCLQEAYEKGEEASKLGPHCKSLNDWALAHRWAVGGAPD